MEGNLQSISKKGEDRVQQITAGNQSIKHLRGDLCKSGPGHFALEKSFPSNFAQ